MINAIRALSIGNTATGGGADMGRVIVPARTEIVAVIDLIRHGQSRRNLKRYEGIVNGRLPLTPLTARGRTQMVRLRSVYKRVELVPRVVFTPKHILRTHNSADILSEEYVPAPTRCYEERLGELYNGEAEGCDKRDVNTPEMLRRYQQHPGTFRYEGGESIYQVEGRMAGFLGVFRAYAHDYAQVPSHKRNIYYAQAVTSRGAIVAALRHVLGVDPNGLVDLRILGDYIGNGSVTRIGFDVRGVAYIMFIGKRDAAHLRLKTRF